MSQTNFKITKESFLLRFFNKTRALLLFLGFQDLELQNDYKHTLNSYKKDSFVILKFVWLISPQCNAENMYTSRCNSIGHPCNYYQPLACLHVWWPDIDTEIEMLVHHCAACQSIWNSQPPTTLHPWAWPNRPWQRAHLDFSGPFLGHL